MKKIALLLFVVFIGNTMQAQDWDIMKSPSLGLTNIATMGDTVIVANRNELYISFDLGTKWENISAPEWGSQSTLTDVAVVKNRIFVTIYTFGTFMTEDRGKTWTRYESGMGLTAYSLCPIGDAILVATDKRVFIGNAMTPTSTFKKIGKAQGDIKYVFGTRQKVCAVTYDNKASLMTYKNEKWEVEVVNEGLPIKDDKNKYLKPWGIDMDSNGSFLITFNQNSIYRLNETSKKWELFLEKSAELKSKSVTALVTKGNTTWIGTSEGGIHRTDDNGATFSGRLNGGNFVNSNEIKIGTNYLFAITNYGLAKGGINLK